MIFAIPSPLISECLSILTVTKSFLETDTADDDDNPFLMIGFLDAL